LKTLLCLFGLLAAFTIRSQTALYFYKTADNTILQNDYVYVDQASGKLFACKVSAEGKKESKPVHIYPYRSTTIEINSNKIYAWVRAYHRDEKTKIMVENSTETKLMLGYITEDKKIINYGGNISNTEATAFYIKDNKIYNSDNTIIREFEGEENYAVACLLCQIRQ
jgi:hypothetical protein